MARRGQGPTGVNKCCDINGNKTFYQDIFCYNRFVCSKYAKGYNQAKTLFVEKDYTFMKFVIKYQQDFTHNSRFDTSIHPKDNTGFPCTSIRPLCNTGFPCVYSIAQGMYRLYTSLGPYMIFMHLYVPWAI